MIRKMRLRYLIIFITIGFSALIFGFTFKRNDTYFASSEEKFPLIVGAIRWDGWVGPLNKAGLEIEHTLSPNKYHFRAPFYSKEISKDSIQCREITQEIMDKDISYAKYAGINYWAFCWYSPHSGLDTARQLYLNSRLRNKVKWCVILGTDSFNYVSDSKWLIRKFKEKNYQKVLNGRPLVYLFPSQGNKLSQLNLLRTLSKGAGIPNPYIVVMAFNSKNADSICNHLQGDAISCYASTFNFETGAQYNGSAYYPTVLSSDKAGWDKYKATGRDVIPWVTSGWDPRPRIERSVSWSTYYKSNGWAEEGTPNQIAENVQNAIIWAKSNADVDKSQAILIYAWNEFDEGGWICPTFGFNTSRLEKIRKTLINK
ncbi:MAG: hypothetical protein EPN39_13760 [Chitinophagaceae bacterium]|nr:MAG: hypothetical protein EPN39_13760 [Chitinophagaceae bacterium]